MSSGKVKTASNVFSILETIERLGQSTCSELAGHLDLSVSSVHNYLRTLVELGYVIEEDGVYRLSLRFLEMGVKTRNSYAIMQAVLEPVSVLSKTINEYISVFVRQKGTVVMIHEMNTNYAVETPTPFLGRAFDIVRLPQGKVVLAYMDDDERRKLLERELPEERFEELNYGALRAELDAIRKDGFVVDDGEFHENIWALAAAVKGDNQVHGSILVSTMRHRLDDYRARNELPQLLDHTIKEVESRLSKYDLSDAYTAW